MLGIFINEIIYKHVEYIYTHGCFTKYFIDGVKLMDKAILSKCRKCYE